LKKTSGLLSQLVFIQIWSLLTGGIYKRFTNTRLLDKLQWSLWSKVFSSNRWPWY